ncbi:MAG: bifunctional diguanylate cyclase/phosphodiesterase, partial [Actinomycetota bacterium]|nr:bifunctional diguanylate cyclase/phosphodiesterase [Actinomycetota bacterium]
LREHARARRQTERAQDLLAAAGQVHDSMALGDVERAIVRVTMSLVRCRKARVDEQPPGPGEVGVPVADVKMDRWLVISDPIGFDPFGQPDRELLAVIAQIGAGAIHNARLLEDIRHRSIHDPVTDLANKVLFMDRLTHALAKAPSRRSRLAVLLLDLDHFKVVNDSLGHETGDQVLISVASRLRAAIRPGDTVARLGGDEFAVLCEQVNDSDDPAAMAEQVRAAVSGPFTSANTVDVSISASVGIVIVDQEWKYSAEATLQAADTAMYRAKERGRDRVEVFDDELRNRAFHRLQTESTLRRALDDGRLRVFYQPILDVGTGRIVEAEALLRVETPAGTLLSPADFIEVAEGSGLIATIGVGVLEEACRQAVSWRKQFGDAAPARIAVNLSAQQLSRVPVAETVQRVLASTGCRPDMLALEITETVLMEAGEHSRTELTMLRNLGVAIGLDDFGTGYSSLAYIKRFPLDFVKIDRCFVAGLGHDPEDEAIVDAIINLGRSLGLASVAEGVETIEQMDRLRTLGCDRMQGFLFARPQPASEVVRLLAGGNPWERSPQLALPPRR